jgi:predicted nucleotidyltransferase
MNCGLNDNTIQKIRNVFTLFPEVEETILYGSRANGKFKPGSDIDLTLKGFGLNLSVINKISMELDDLLLPYTIDLSIYQQIGNADLIDHIKRVGVLFYKKNPAVPDSGINGQLKP